MEATTGFEPVNRGFADLRVKPLHHVAMEPLFAGSRVGGSDAGCPSRIRTSVHGSKIRCPTTRRRGSGCQERNWSGRRDSNPRPSPWQGDALPTEPLPLEKIRPPVGGAESQDRTGDTAIFSRVLYQLSYLGPMANQAVGCPSAGGTIPRASRDHQGTTPCPRLQTGLVGRGRWSAGGPQSTLTARNSPSRPLRRPTASIGG